MKKYHNIITWALRIIAAVILLQTLFFKFSGAEESKYIFSKLNAEPWGRIGSGIIELIAAVLILIPASTGIGALIGAGTMAGAMLSHLFILGISVKNSDGSEDNGQLFLYALIVFVACLYLVWMNRKKIPILKNFFA
jgi:uncharacterized membrane protein YphA (DoxX/SURF4 family)